MSQYQWQSKEKQISSSERRINLFAQLLSSELPRQQKPSLSSSCSEEKLMLRDIIQANKANDINKPQTFPSKLNEARRRLLNNTIDKPNEYLITHKYRLNNMPQGFQDKYLELAKYTGNEIKINKSSSQMHLRPLTPNRPKGKESKVGKLKQEILISLQTTCS